MVKCRNLKNIILVIVGVFFACLFFPQTLHAAALSMQIVYEYEETAIKGAVFDIYKVAEAGEEVKLDEIVISKHQLPTDSGVTNAAGLVSFPNQKTELEAGIYYVKGRSCECKGEIYRCSPFLVRLPAAGEDGQLENDVVAYPKSAVSEEYVGVTVTKIWKDHHNAEKKRPAEIEAKLLCDGVVFDTVKLSDKNGWTYRWEDLSAASEWTVKEVKVPKGYKTSVNGEMTEKGLLEFEIINTYEKKGKKPSRLPQTGMLHWPVPVLAETGLLFFMIGWRKRQKDEE